MNRLNNIAIIGMGLIGGSIAKALKKRGPRIPIATLKQDDLDLKEAVDTLFDTWEELIAWSDLIILATPLSTLSPLAAEIAKRCPKEKSLLVIDVGSVKKAVFPCFETLSGKNLEFLSTHPMAGKETSGFANSDADLFQDRSWILSPHEKNHSSTLEVVSDFIATLGAKTVIIDPKKHDEQVALISHLPALLSRDYLKFVEGQDPESLKIAGPGFKSMTRLAHDNPQMQKEISDFNREEIIKQLKSLIKFISKEEGI